MKKIFLAAISIVCLMASCSKDETEIPAVNPLEGQEVQFTSSVSAATRTLYAEEYENSIAVKWVNGDLISVYGVDCAVKQAEYKVTGATGTEDTNNDGTADTNYYYASSLDKTGAAGVQWGEDGTSDFYAVYPSTEDSFTKNDDGTVTVPTTIRTTQNVSFTKQTINGYPTWVGTHYATDSDNPTMTDAVMYAVTPDASATNADGTAKSVDLNFKPFSNVLRFTFDGYQAYKQSGSNLAKYQTTIYVQKITLTAPTARVAGDFDLVLGYDDKKQPLASAIVPDMDTEKTGQIITIVPEQYFALKCSDGTASSFSEKIQFDVFTIPQSVNLPGTDELQAWTVTLSTNMGEFSYKLRPTTGNDSDGNPIYTDLAKFKAGQMHKINVPQMTYSSNFEIPLANWIKYVPRNVYISELSLPGAWYAIDSGYQGDIGLASDTKTYSLTENTDGSFTTTTTTAANGIDDGLENLFFQGVRAFNIDCRLTLAEGIDVENYDTATDNWYGTTHDRVYVDNIDHATNENILVLACSGTETRNTGSTSINSIGMTVEEALISLGKLANNNQDEFIEVVITVAEKPKTESALDFSTTDQTYGTINAQMMTKAIAMVLNKSTVSQYIYQGPVTPNTTVKDVVGKMLVKVNLNTTDANIKTFNTAMPALISEGSMVSDSSYQTDTNYVSLGNFGSRNTPNLYWSNSYSATAMTYDYHQCQNTTGTVTVDMRKAAITSIMQTSMTDYANLSHDTLIQLGLGGWNAEEENSNKFAPKMAIAASLHPHVLSIINAMLAYDETATDKTAFTYAGVEWKPAPVGAILMNGAGLGDLFSYTYTTGIIGQTTHTVEHDIKSASLIEAIMGLNNKIRLNRDENQAEWPDGNSPFPSVDTSSGTVDGETSGN